jgi:hypothetical protein
MAKYPDVRGGNEKQFTNNITNSPFPASDNGAVELAKEILGNVLFGIM